jgi:ribose/xylose/arabinose/galactoside ABC-type transport system permease subunit
MLRDLMPVVALVVLVAVFSLLGWWTGQGRFFSLQNAALVICNSSTITVGALGMMLIIAIGGIDLSAGTMLGLCAAVMAACLSMAGDGQPLGPQTVTWIVIMVMMLTVLTGGACGAANGSLISYFRLAPFIVTLGAMAIYQGLALIVSDQKTVATSPQMIPSWLRLFVSASGFRVAYGFVPLIPLGIAVELLLAGVLAVVLQKTVFGRHLLAIGANETAARLCGIRVTAMRVVVYMLGGLCFGLAGLYQFALIKSYSPGTGVGKELDIIAAVVIGGGSLKGGRASVLGTLVGSLLMQVIRSGCTQLSVPNPYQHIIIGAIIIAAVLFDRAAGRVE